MLKICNLNRNLLPKQEEYAVKWTEMYCFQEKTVDIKQCDMNIKNFSYYYIIIIKQ